jgi:hypothetical protein
MVEWIWTDTVLLSRVLDSRKCVEPALVFDPKSTEGFRVWLRGSVLALHLISSTTKK